VLGQSVDRDERSVRHESTILARGRERPSLRLFAAPVLPHLFAGMQIIGRARPLQR
jgi:hypothetical protein